MDIDRPEYPYSPFNRVLASFAHLSTDLRQEVIKVVDPWLLVKDFQSVEWKQFDWLNTNLTLEILKEEFQFDRLPRIIDHSDAPFEVIHGERKRDGKSLDFVFIPTEEITETNLQEMLRHYTDTKLRLLSSNIGSENWYGPKYQTFLKCMNHQ